jgi:hypothetical protein
MLIVESQTHDFRNTAIATLSVQTIGGIARTSREDF